MKTQPLQKLIAPIIAIVASLALFMGPLEAQVDSLAPPFEIADSNGTPLNFPDELEGPTIVLFWASWCPYCKALMPHLQSIVDEYEGEIEVLALNFRDDEDPVEFMAEYGYDFRVFPLAGPVATLWGVKATPGLFLVDESGQIVFSNFSIPESAYPSDPNDEGKEFKHYRKASRRAPFWAAQLRLAIDKSRAPAN
jgi:thiol-disulfide isomerase/thioredoxin